MMKTIANLLFEARILKEIPRSGYHFLGSGRESVAEHAFLVTFIGYVLAQIHPDANGHRIMQMCLIHDLGEARTGDLNYVQKRYVKADEDKAMADLAKDLPFGAAIRDLFEEYRTGDTPEAQLAHDADQLALIVELRTLRDSGCKGPEAWIPHVIGRLRTETGKSLAQEVLNTPSDAWWFEEKGHDF